MAKLEYASFLTVLPETSPAGSSRLYFGAEFCFWRLPSVEDILRARTWAREFGLDFTLVTPVLGEDERVRLNGRLEKILPELDPGDATLISDWGALDLVRAVRDDLAIVLGPSPSGQKRGPRILGMSLPAYTPDSSKHASWPNHGAD